MVPGTATVHQRCPFPQGPALPQESAGHRGARARRLVRQEETEEVSALIADLKFAVRMLAACLPVCRASRVDPVEALRSA